MINHNACQIITLGFAARLTFLGKHCGGQDKKLGTTGERPPEDRVFVPQIKAGKIRGWIWWNHYLLYKSGRKQVKAVSERKHRDFSYRFQLTWCSDHRKPYFRKSHGDQRVFSIRNNHKCLSQLFLWFIWIPMLWVYGHYRYFHSYSASIHIRRHNLMSTDVRFRRLKSILASSELKVQNLPCSIITLLKRPLRLDLKQVNRA